MKNKIKWRKTDIMEEKIKIEEAIELVKSGFDWDLIAFEYDLSSEDINNCKMAYEKSLQSSNNRKKETDTQTTVDSKYKRSHSIMEKMRKRYEILCSNNINYSKKSVDQTDKERETVEITIKKIEQIVSQMQSQDKRQTQKMAIEILKDIRKIQAMQLTNCEIEKLYNLLSQDIFESIKDVNKTYEQISACKNSLKKRLNRNKINEKIDKTEDIDTLRQLLNMIDSKNVNSQMQLLRDKINDKIARLQMQNNKRDFSVPEEIERIAKGLSEGNLKLENARQILEQKAQESIEERKQTRFTLTKEQEINKSIIQINQMLTNKADQYQITNAQKAIEDLIYLGCESTETAVSIVVKNLAANGRIDEAKQICDKYKKQEKYYQYMRLLRKNISNEEIRIQAIKYLTTDDVSLQEEVEFLRSLENKIKNNEISTSAIILGKSIDGLHSITLKEIYDDSIIEI